ncbi:hypothetical protein ABZ912_60965 [Nonomuraea angiospora]|uniref:hypothetical protein n=1 Tax=Nonomuraea angiospora TaxID=46172 RepID=UPI0033C75742
MPDRLRNNILGRLCLTPSGRPLDVWWQRNPEGGQATGVVPDSSCSTRAGGSGTRVRASAAGPARRS